MSLSNKKNDINEYAQWSSMVWQMLIIIGIGVFGGYLLDNYIKLKFPLFTLLFSFLSVFVSIYLVIKQVLNKK